MRKVIAVEGKVQPNGMMLTPGALKDPGKDIPIVMGMDHQTIVGKATGFERNTETGEISFDIQFAPAYSPYEAILESSEVSLSCYGLEVQDKSIESAKVGEAVFMPFAGFPKAFAGPFSIAKDEVVEGKVVERSWMTVGELIEKLKEFDPNWPVATKDNEYGLQFDVTPRKYELEAYEARYMRMIGDVMEAGDRVVVID